MLFPPLCRTINYRKYCVASHSSIIHYTLDFHQQKNKNPKAMLWVIFIVWCAGRDSNPQNYEPESYTYANSVTRANEIIISRENIYFNIILSAIFQLYTLSRRNEACLFFLRSSFEYCCDIFQAIVFHLQRYLCFHTCSLQQFL